MRVFYAHSGNLDDRSDWEPLEAHALRVANAAERRASVFGGGTLARAAGLLHDLGKAKFAFQRRLAGARQRVSHSGEGALSASHEPTGLGQLIAPGIIGHHGALPNILGEKGLTARLRETDELSLPSALTPPALEAPQWVSAPDADPAFRLQFLARMIFAALVEADERETAAFYAEQRGEPRAREGQVLDAGLRTAFRAYMAQFDGAGAVDSDRRCVLEHALSRACDLPGPFTLTVPTGGGKTLASLGFALEHAAQHGLLRLIYVIPYTSIVEQTAAVFRAVLGDDAVLEHHASFDWKAAADDDDEEADRLRREAQSWDAPVVVTTAIQFFESLFAARKKRCRKLAVLAGSVVVVDEAQTMPRHLLRPCLAALKELMAGYGASVVLSTATQPALTRSAGLDVPEALETPTELAPEPKALYDRLRRVRVTDIGARDDAAIADRMKAADQVLAIVDNRVQARGLYDLIQEVSGARHLSTLMTPAHRRAVLADIRADLSAGRPTRVAATSLVEAGVDVDFPLVMRAASGLDSLAQAAGRCNREGALKGLGTLEVFRSDHPAPPEVAQRAEIGAEILERFADDPLSPEAIAAYFRELLHRQGAEALDAAHVFGPGGGDVDGVCSAIAKAGRDFRFADIEAAFRLIDETQPSLIIRGGTYGMSEDVMKDLAVQSATALARAAQPYTIPVPWGLWRQLRAAHAVAPWWPAWFGEQFYVLTNETLYEETAGLRVEGFETFEAIV